VDYIFRWMGMQFIHGYRDQNAPRRPASIAAATPAEPAGDSHARTVKEDTGWQQRMDGGSTRSDRMSPGVMGGLDASASVAGGSERIAVILSEASIIDGSARPMADGSPGATAMATIPGASVAVDRHAHGTALDQSNAALMGDAPACDSCGSITVRNGTCYRCMNCGNSMGCS
jgi:ribonucleoside-diphosphate reductase alpha chain